MSLRFVGNVFNNRQKYFIYFDDVKGTMAVADKNGDGVLPSDMTNHLKRKIIKFLDEKVYGATKPIISDDDPLAKQLINMSEQAKHGADTDLDGVTLVSSNDIDSKTAAAFAATRPSIQQTNPYTGNPEVDSKIMDRRIKNGQLWKGYVRNTVKPDIPTPLKQNTEILQEPAIEKQFDLKESMKTEVKQQKIEEEQQKIEDATNAENFEKVVKATKSIIGDETGGESTTVKEADKKIDPNKPKKFFGMEHPVRSLLGVAFGAALATGTNMLFSGGKKTAGGGSPVASASSNAGSEGGKQPPPKDDKEDGGMSAIMSAMEKAYANIQVPEAYKNASREYNDMFKMTPDNARMRQTSAVDEAAMKVHEIYGNTITSFYDQLLAGLGKSNGEKSAKLLESNSKLRSDVASLMENSAKIAMSLSVPMGSKDYAEALKLRAEGARGIMNIMSPETWDKMSVAALKAADGIVEVAKYNAQMGMAKVNASIAANKNTGDYKNKRIQYDAAKAKMTSSKELAKKIFDEQARATEQARIDQVYMDDLRNIENNSFAKLY